MSSYQQGGAFSLSNNDEGKPLLSKNGHSSLTKRPIASTQYLLALIAAFLLSVALFLNIFVPRTTTTQTAPALSSAEEPETTVLYRPLCEIHSERFTVAQGIQTSMQDPSHQWSTMSCFPVVKETKSSFLFARPPPPDPPRINTYSAPDAIFAVSFDTLAFPGRPPILGFGGAFTEAAARNFHTLSADGQELVLELLFGKDGLGYGLGRLHMNSCDFSVESYSFDETDGDFDLKDFDMQVTHDVETGMVDFAKRAVSKFRQDWSDDDNVDGNMKLYASPWSPPSWMKNPTWQDDKNATYAAKMTYSTQPSCLREGTGKKSKYAAAWALYFSKYLKAYSNLGLPFWGVTVQNEPEFPAPWEACSYTPMTEQQFVAYHLGPQLERDHPDVKILIFDHNKDHIMNWTKNLLNETKPAAKYVAGTSYHWYAGGMDRLLDGALGISNLHRLQQQLLTKRLETSHLVLGSESCHCPSTGYSGGDINVYWSRAERYTHTILADLAAGSNGWVEWNLILDSIGGPNHLGNLCESTILAVPHRAKDAPPDISDLPEFEVHFPMGNVSIGDGRTREELNALGFPAKYLDKGVAVQPIYFYMGHVSRHVRPGSRSVPGLVTQGNTTAGNRIFRPQGSVVNGGGQNDLARVGIEVTLWPCEGSTRQQFSWTNGGDGKHPYQIVVRGHDWLGHPTTSCIANTEDPDFLGVRLDDCDSKRAGVFDINPVPDDPLGRSRIHIKNFVKSSGKKSNKENCLVVRKLQNNGGAYGPRGGAQVTIGSCSNSTSLWSFDAEVGELISYELASVDSETGTPLDSDAVCMTTGWPFLQMGAFTSADSNKTVVVLNEARDPANYALVDDGDLVMTGSIPPRSVQTFTLSPSSQK
eukprot:scaffold6562_cov163-Amphora_coffeaeformis.AAC.10